MSTTRHLINRQRRLASASTTTTTTTTKPKPSTSTTAPAPGSASEDATEKNPSTPAPVRRSAAATVRPASRTAAVKPRPPSGGTRGERGPRFEKAPQGGAGTEDATGRGRRPVRLVAVLGVLAALLAGFAVWAGTESGALRDTPASRNTALSDTAATSEVKGKVSEAVDALFSYDYASPGKQERAAGQFLTGRAVKQQRAMLAPVRKQGKGQKLVLTTTVTDAAVEQIDGDRARVLLFADQRSVRTGAKGGKAGKGATGKKASDDSAYAGAMLAVDAVRRGGEWKIAAIDTFN